MGRAEIFSDSEISAFQLICLLTRMVRLVLFLFSLGLLVAAQQHPFEDTISYLLCDKYTSGSLRERATNISAYLEKTATKERARWLQVAVFIWKASEGWATGRGLRNSVALKNVSGHDVLVFHREHRDYDSFDRRFRRRR